MTLCSHDIARSSDTLKPLYLHYHNAYGHRPCRMVTYFEWLLTIKWHNTVHVVLQSHMTNKNHYISSTSMPMATKLGRMVAYFERILTIRSFYVLIMWSCKVTWQTKIIIYPQPECLWLHTWQNDNLPWWVPSDKVTSPFDHVVLQDHVTN